MKLFTYIPDNTANRISAWHLVIFIILLPVDRYLSQLALLSFTAHTLIHLNKAGIKRILTKENAILSAVWLVTVAGLLYSPDRQEANKDVMIQLGIAGFPLVLSLTDMNLVKYRRLLLSVFAFTCTAAVLYLYADALLIIFYYGFPLKTLFSYSFINQNFSSPLAIHATYLCMFLALAAVIFLDLSLREKNKKYLCLYIICIAILLGGLLQLASRAVWVAMLLFIIIPFPLLAASGKKRLKIFAVTILAGLISVYIISGIDVFRKRYIAEFRDDLKTSSLSRQTPEPRLIRWNAVMELIRVSPFMGYGSGSEKKLLKEKYYEKHLYTSYLLELNTHNQYLAIWLKTGLWGLLIFLGVLLWAIRFAWRQKDLVCCCLICLVTVVSFSENILEVNKGVFFFGFFLTLLVKTGKPSLRILRSDKNPELV